MSDRREALELRLVELRSAFDAAFARKPEKAAGERRGYLGIRLNGAPYALDLEEVRSVRKGVHVTPVPSDEPELLGVAGFSGTLTAVYDLGRLLGLPGGSQPTWFALVRGAPVVLAFHGLEGQLRAELGSEAVVEPPGDEDGASDLTWPPGLSRPVIRLGSLVARLRGVVTESGNEGAASR
jgi:hypothetical protein